MLAGSFEMPWRPFLTWNTAGGIVWVMTHVLLGYYVGEVAGIERGLLIILGVKLVLVAILAAIMAVRRRVRRASADHVTDRQ